jgi:hypothetical protein
MVGMHPVIVNRANHREYLGIAIGCVRLLADPSLLGYAGMQVQAPHARARERREKHVLTRWRRTQRRRKKASIEHGKYR